MLPILKEEKTNTKKYIVDVKGLNLGEGWQDGELADSKNVSSALYPSITQRYERELIHAIADRNADAIVSKNGLVIVSYPYIWHDGNLNRAYYLQSGGRKKVATVGDHIYIFPDKVWYNTVTKEGGNMEVWMKNASIGGNYSTVHITENTILFSGYTFGPIKTGLYPYTQALESNGTPFRIGDAVTITGCTQATDNNKTVVIRDVEFSNGIKLIFSDNVFTPATENGDVTLTRKIPDMDVICESNYRLWGAKGNTIYGSKYGDPLNFNTNEGLASDSYAIEVGSEGDFTGAHHFGSYVCFFKESCLHKLYGTKPANYQLTTSQVHGVQKGSERSLVNVNETLYYKGANGLYAYGGGVPELISGAFGTARFTDACAASDGDRYYVSMQNADGWHFMVYDILRGIWLKEDDLHCLDMISVDGRVHLLNDSGLVYVINPDAERRSLEWSITFCPFNETVNERKGYSKFMIRAELAEGAWLKLEYKRDNAPKWQEAVAVENTRRRTMWFPIMPERCDSVQVRISGKGECILRSFVREFNTGSDV